MFNQPTSVRRGGAGVLRRTKFYDRSNVLSLRIESQRRRLLQRKAERDQAKAQSDRLRADRNYLVGLMIEVKDAPLTDRELELCLALRAWPLDEDVPKDKIMALYRVITRLLHNPEAITMMTFEADEVIDGGMA